MANTTIQLKRSSTTTAPSTLSAGEPAYSYLSDKLFIGTADGLDVIEIGGRYYINVATQAYDTANSATDIAIAAFAAANSGDSVLIGLAYDQANAAYAQANVAPDIANSYADLVGAGSNAYATLIGTSGNSYTDTVGTNVGAGANAYADSVGSNVGAGANSYANQVGAGSNAYATLIGASSNAYADTVGSNVGAGANSYADTVGSNVGAGANSYADSVGAGSNAYATLIGASSNSYADQVGAGSNGYATLIGASSNSYANQVGAGSNAYADLVGASANSYADSTFLPLSGGTVTGNLSIVGNFTVSGNTSYVNVEEYKVNDPLIYLAANNYVGDIVDIGFIANYVNASSYNVHTAFYREHEDGEYYLIVGYDQEPTNNHIGVVGTHNSTLAYLNANLRAEYIEIGGTNVLTLISNGSDISNSYADLVGAGSNAYADSVGSSVGAGANAYADLVGAGSNAYATLIGASSNSYANQVGAGSNAYATLIGTSSNAYADLVGAAANTNASDASYISTGTLAVSYGGTGLNSVANNGVTFGNGTSALRVTAAGTEGQVLQANIHGTPFFGMLDGGQF